MDYCHPSAAGNLSRDLKPAGSQWSCGSSAPLPVCFMSDMDRLSMDTCAAQGGEQPCCSDSRQAATALQSAPPAIEGVEDVCRHDPCAPESAAPDALDEPLLNTNEDRYVMYPVRCMASYSSKHLRQSVCTLASCCYEGCCASWGLSQECVCGDH